MKISCLCPTFARTKLLEEAIESFLRQDYRGEKELVICNDFYRQKLRFSHPEVRVANFSTRFHTLGAKRNATASLATGTHYLTWGDDDIHLPDRISRMVEFIHENDLKFAKEGQFYCKNLSKILHVSWASEGAHIIEADLYWALGGIPEENMGEDVSFNKAVQRHLGTALPINPKPPAFLYRWEGTARPHLSGLDPASGYSIMLDRAEELIAKGKEPSGEVVLTPRWTQDWVEAVKHAVPQ